MATRERGSSTRDMLRGLMIGIAVLGVVVLLFGGYRYLTARQILDSPEMRTPQTVNLPVVEGVEVNQETAALANVPFDLIRRHNDAERQLNEGALIAGAGLVALGIGWFGYDLTRRKARAS